jgi:uroporphyrinogen III methyltransferase/synthase
LEKLGLRIDFVPAEYKAEGIIEGLVSNEVKGKKILIPRAAVAREVLPEELVKLGATVDVVEAYKTIKPKGKTGELREMLKNKEVHVITFTSSSTVTNFISMFNKEEISDLLNGVTIACIGPITAETAEKNGLKVSIIPGNYTVEAFTDAIVDFYQ